jgi:hypothetical protein
VKKELYICDGVDGKECRTVLIAEGDGFVVRGSISTCLSGSAQKTLVPSITGNPSSPEIPAVQEEVALCHKCMAIKLGFSEPVP